MTEARELKTLDGAHAGSTPQKIARVLWDVTWILLAAWTPPQFRRWRNILLRLFGANIAPTAMVYASARIWWPRNLMMAAHSCLGRGAICYNMAPVSLGEYCVVSQRAHLCAGTHDIESEDFRLIAKPIVFGAWSWIAAEAFVGPGVTVSEGAVLGARAVAFNDLTPWTVYAGNPAQPLKQRVIRPK
jgi:putative colanic acid biosynthesis acetyltransferase WcaF